MILKNLSHYYCAFILSFVLLGVVFPVSAISSEAPSLSELGTFLLRYEEVAPIPEMVLVGDPQNNADPKTGLGAVGDFYQIGKYEVTVGQYLQFALSMIRYGDPHHLLPEEVFRDPNISLLTEVAEGKVPLTEGSLDPSIVKEELHLPMTYVSLEDAKYYCNWLHQGAPLLDQPLTPEEVETILSSGAYDFTQGKKGELMPGAEFFMPDINLWYKAAYGRPSAPTDLLKQNRGELGADLPENIEEADIVEEEVPPIVGDSDTISYSSTIQYLEDPVATLPHGMPLVESDVSARESNYLTASFWKNSYYCEGPPYLTPVEHFEAFPSGYGCVDMGGNVREWTSTGDLSTGFFAPGGSWKERLVFTKSHNIKARKAYAPDDHIGFRVCTLSPFQQEGGGNVAAFINNTIPPRPAPKWLQFMESYRLGVLSEFFTMFVELLLNLFYQLTIGGTIGAAIMMFAPSLSAFGVRMGLNLGLLTLNAGFNMFVNDTLKKIQALSGWKKLLLALAACVLLTLAFEASVFVVEASISAATGSVPELASCFEGAISSFFTSYLPQYTDKAMQFGRIVTNVVYIGTNSVLNAANDTFSSD
jgi:hypothetical protein